MTKLLLHYNPAWTTSKPVPLFRYIIKLLRPLCVLCFLFLSTAALGQQVDTWLTADRAVNSAPTPNGQFQLFTPLAPADGTPVTTWYDFIDGTPQDAVQHPTPADYPQPYPLGFEHSFGSPAYLNPIGSVPRVPTLRRDDMNFNPSIEFDGSGDGQALHFRSSTREEITIFIVFHARGMGNTAETQRLLFGGDIDTYHSSTTNLSIGISDGNRFSLGRTWTPWSDFESGNIDLQGLPTIGVLIRQVDTNPFLEDEVLRTQVNGLSDINIMKNLPDIERDLYLFNRLGKHFNSNDSNRNLTGNIAEILLADGPLDANSIQRVESYLAIKYGITLNNTGQLGSTVGNQGYTYLAADGTTIWQPDPIYLYDIAGLGRDRYQDFDGGDDSTSYDDLKLRYNLHQRIAKSENSEAVVTMSTDTNFATDNLDQSRPIIDNTTANSLSVTTTSTLHNYLLWGNDHGDINQSLVELPTDYSARIGREWKIQKTVSPGGVDPIANVSVQINLSGSDILNNGNCGDVTLLIDTDGDGDFLTGTLTEILATSIDAGQNAYFDNVNFEHQDVFTIAIVDNIPPTASNPLTLTVCGVAPLPDPSVVTDEADNCAVDTVIHIGDVSDGLINPETITRTYRITDIYGNYTDVQQIIYVYLQPNVNDIPDQEACESYILPPITGTNLSGNESYYDLPGGPLGGGGTYNEGDVITSDITLYIYDETGGVSTVCFDEESFIITITPQPDAGNDANINICEGNVLTDADLFAQLGGTPDAGGTWSPAFAGAGVYTYTVTATAPCTTDATATVTVTEQPQPDAPLDVESCDAYILPALANGNYFDAPNGGGNALSVGDYINTTTTIYVFSPGNGSCTDMENSFTVTITGFEISTNVENETCWQSQDGIAHVNVFNTNLPLTVQLDSMPSTIFNQNAFSFDNLSAGNHTLTVIDQNGCQSEANFEILAGGPNLDASIEPIYLCDSGLPSNTIAVTLSDPSISNAVLYALDSTSPNDFIMTPDFEDITPGNHSLSILHTNGCLLEIPFSIDHVEPLSLSLATVYVNEITANASGGIPPYTYYFGDNPGSSSNTFTIDRSGTFQVRVVDNNGCETTETITMTLIEISVPNFFTPNNDGQNDYWRPRNMEWFPDVQTYIFDRYGRKIKIMGAMDEGWDGHYESKPLPSGDYWYIIKLNDGSDREFVGHFTLYR
nr:T9SS type B sorting domain-containing protein [Allomuricauda sp.]